LRLQAAHPVPCRPAPHKVRDAFNFFLMTVSAKMSATLGFGRFCCAYDRLVVNVASRGSFGALLA
jgi:hypothetical protein